MPFSLSFPLAHWVSVWTKVLVMAALLPVQPTDSRAAETKSSLSFAAATKERTAKHRKATRTQTVDAQPEIDRRTPVEDVTPKADVKENGSGNAVGALAAVDALEPPPEVVKGEVDGTEAVLAEKLAPLPEDEDSTDVAHDVQVGPGEFYRVGAKDTVHGLTVIFGKAKVEGKVHGNVVVFFGNLTVVGTVDGFINCVGGRVVLGSKSVVQGDLVGFGKVDRHPGSVINGRELIKRAPSVRDLVEHGPSDWMGRLSPEAHAFWTDHIFRVRPLSFRLAWPWIVLLGVVLAQAMIVLIMPGAVRRTAMALGERPATTLMLGFLALPIIALLSLVLLTTVIGVPFFWIAVFLGSVVGKVALEVQLGSKFLGIFNGGLVAGGSARGAGAFGSDDSPERPAPMWAAFGLGATLLALIYLIPYLGFIMWGGLTLWGIGAVILVIFSRRRGETRTVPPVVPAGRGFDSPPVNDGWTNPSSGETVSSVVPADLILPTATGLTGVSSTIPALSYVTSSGPASASGPGVTSMPEVSRPTPPPLGASERVQDLWALPRVGLGPRLLALLMDVSVLGLLSMVLPNWIHRIPYADGLFVLGYFAGFWMSHGATIGGLLIGLRVIRLDGRAIDWQVAIVRSLSSFLSLFSAGLGEFWCAWDRDQQTWQDKLAGTVVVKEARLRSLI